MGRVIAVASGKGGVGKSTLAAGLGCAFAARGHGAVLLDADEGLRSLDLMLGVTDALVFDLADILATRCRIEQAVRPVLGVPNLSLIAAPMDLGVLSDAGEFRALCGELSARFDEVLIDCPAGIDRVFRATAFAADLVLLVATADPVCMRAAAQVRALLDGENIPCRLVLNRFDAEMIRGGGMPNLDEMVDGAEVQLIGVVPEDVQAPLHAARGKPLFTGRAADAMGRIARRLAGERIPLPRLTKL